VWRAKCEKKCKERQKEEKSDKTQKQQSENNNYLVRTINKK
jgi:hypothetical protein